MPGAFPGSPSEHGTPSVPAKRMKTMPTAVETTPKAATPIKPSSEEMHPQLHHQTTAKPRDEARWLGFSHMIPATEPPKRDGRAAGSLATPSRTSIKVDNPFKSPDFNFTFRREQSLELSPEAKKLMEEKRAEAIRIKEQMKASVEGKESSMEALGRKIATPKGAKGRFSDMHQAQFQKMDSIAGHASAYRKDPARTTMATAESRIPAQSATKSLKRSPSKAELDKAEGTPTKTIHRSQSRPNLHAGFSQLPRAPSMKNLKAGPSQESPAKRVKIAEHQDASAACPPSSSSSDLNKGLPLTPQQDKTLRIHPSNPGLPHLSTPTQASLARAGTVKSAKVVSKIPGPGLSRSPSKPNLVDRQQDSPKGQTPLLARSPTKGSVFGASATSAPVEKNKGSAEPLLTRTPMKVGPGHQRPAQTAQDGSPSPVKGVQAPLLARSPVKNSAGVQKTAEPEQERQAQQAPLLSRSPLKMSVAQNTDVEESVTKPSSVPFLARSPAKASVNKNPFESSRSETPAKPSSKGLMSRLNLLRASPMKSILRSPQRLYSNDPSKIAAGTHVATPPKQTASRQNTSYNAAPATEPVRKHVDFTSSTKAREASKSSSPSDAPTTPPREPKTSLVVPAPIAEYPSLPSVTSPLADPSPQRRRQTIAPGDFTFRMGDSIVFGQSPNAPKNSSQRASTIRHISAEPEIGPSTTSKKRKFDFEQQRSAAEAEGLLSPTMVEGTKKRKFDFENHAAAAAAEGTSDKENAGEEVDEVEERPAKRARSMGTSPIKKEEKRASRMPTLGVKPKAGTGAATGAKREAEKKPSSISRARLNALAMPKKRS